jgi:hypothetical protein
MVSRRSLLLMALCLSLLLLTPALCRGEEDEKPKHQRKKKVGVGGKLSNKDLEAIEDQWMEDEVEDEGQSTWRLEADCELLQSVTNSMVIPLCPLVIFSRRHSLQIHSHSGRWSHASLPQRP